MKRIGERIRRKRGQLNLQLNDLARKVGVSSSALSQIENAKAFPSIITLKSIAENLHTSVGELIGENESLVSNPVIRKDDIRFVERNDSGTSLYLLSQHDMNKNMDTLLICFVEDSDVRGLITDLKGQVFCHVKTGVVRVKLEGEQHDLAMCDNMYFNAKRFMGVVNIHNGTSELLWILSPPSF